jgi:hypothetical protein
MLKHMLTGMINDRATIFLTTRVLEIVERSCSSLPVILKGRQAALGSLGELRLGMAIAPPCLEQVSGSDGPGLGTPCNGQD